MKAFLPIALIAASISAPTFAAEDDAREVKTVYALRQVCKADPGNPSEETLEGLTMALADSMMCVGYIRGVMSGYESAVVIYGQTAIYCAPENTTNGQWVEIFVKWANEHPENLHNTSAFGVIMAAHDTFPCK